LPIGGEPRQPGREKEYQEGSSETNLKGEDKLMIGSKDTSSKHVDAALLKSTCCLSTVQWWLRHLYNFELFRQIWNPMRPIGTKKTQRTKRSPPSLE